MYEAQNNFKKYKAKEERFISNTRLPTNSDVKDITWRELIEEDKKYSSTPSEIEKVWGTNKAISYNYWERNA